MKHKTKVLTEDKIRKDHLRYATGQLSAWSLGMWRDKYPTRALLQEALDKELIQKLQAIAPPQIEQPKPIEEPKTITSVSTSDWQFEGMTIELKPFQKETADRIYRAFFEQNKSGLLLNAATGTGKTYMAGAIIKRLQHEKWHDNKTLALWPYLIVTKASVVPQFTEVLKYQFGVDMSLVQVTNYDQLRSIYGSKFLKTETVVVNSEPHIVYKWRNHLYPIFVVWDECHALKNQGSQQHKIGAALNDLTDPNLKQIHMSATPFTRLADAMCFVCSTKREWY